VSEQLDRSPKGYKVKGRSLNEIRGLAHRFRGVFELKSPYLDVIRFLDAIVAEGIWELEVVPDMELPIDTWGETRPYQQEDGSIISFIKLKECVYDGASRGNGFHRFTVAHEMGHAIMHTNELSFARTIDHREKGLWYCDSEWQANNFASELLADSRYIRDHDCVADIANRFGISRKSAKIRYKRLFGKQASK